MLMCVLVVALADAMVDDAEPKEAAAELLAPALKMTEDGAGADSTELLEGSGAGAGAGDEAGAGWTKVDEGSTLLEDGSTGAGAGAADEDGSTTALLDGAGAGWTKVDDGSTGAGAGAEELEGTGAG